MQTRRWQRKRTLCRVAAYCFPGLPSPTTSHSPSVSSPPPAAAATAQPVVDTARSALDGRAPAHAVTVDSAASAASRR